MALAASPMTGLLAQEARARDVVQQIAATASGTPEWFALQCELAFADMNVDLAKALATAERMRAAARTGGPAGTAGTAALAAALTGYLLTRTEGPVAAAEWVSQADDLTPPTAPALACYRNLFAAMQRCSTDNHAEELRLALVARAHADTCDDDLLRVRATMRSLHASPDFDSTPLRDAFAAAASHGQARACEFLEPDARFAALQFRREGSSRDEVLLELEALTEVAERTGDRRLLGGVQSLRGGMLFRNGNPAAAQKVYAEAVGIYRQLGDRIDLARSLDLQAWLAIRAEDLAGAKALLEECDATIRDRGFAGLERELLQTRFELAVRNHDAELAERLSRQLDASARERLDEQGALVKVRADQRAAENARDAARQRLAEEQRLAAATADRHRWHIALAALAAAVVIALLAWFGRRRLAAANRELSERMSDLEQARAAQAALEARLQQMVRTESLGTLAAGIAHDFNNLLTGMIGNAELLQRRAPGQDETRLAAAIVTAGQQGARLCRQLQSYAEGVPPVPTSHDLLSLTNQTLPLLQELAGSGIAVRTTVDSRNPMALVDRSQYEQLLLNLVQNSRDAGARNVRIRVAPLAAAGGQQAAVCVEITDDGAGMPPEVAQRVFDPFFTTKFPGRGLGLAVAHGIARRHNGTIEVDSTVGRGTTFRLRLPVEASDLLTRRDPPTTTDEGTAQYTEVTVLVVDDEPAVRRVLSLVLADTGVTVIEAGDGEEALDVARGAAATDRFVAFVDLTMPGMDGSEVVDRLRQLRPDLRVILMSGHSETELARHVADLRSHDSLAKPFHFADVRRALASAAGDRMRRAHAPDQDERADAATHG